MTFIKQTLKNTASLVLAVWIIGSAYAAISTVSSGDPLTADSWNQIVNKLNNTDTNSTDLVTKSYVDSTISANSGGGWSNCETKTWNSTSTLTLTCSAGKAIRSHSYMCSVWYQSSWICSITSLSTTQFVWQWHFSSNNWSTNDSSISASIICCDD